MNYSDFITNLLTNDYLAFQDNEFSKRNRKEIITELDESGTSTTTVNRSKHIFLLIDTCVWINLAQKGDFDNLIRVADLHVHRDAILLMPQQLKIEWERNKEDKVYKKEINSLNELIKKTTSFRDKILQDEEDKEKMTEYIKIAQEIKMEQAEYMGKQTLAIFAEVMGLGTVLETTNDAKLKAIDWSLEKKPPFHKGKNSMGDALIFISCVDYLKNINVEEKVLYFITDNKDDFSEGNNPKILNRELVAYAESQGVSVDYSLDLNGTLNNIFEEVTDLNYVEELKKQYRERYRMCPICNDKLMKNTHPWDGYGNKVFIECNNKDCNYVEETNEYLQDQVIDNIY